jgi:hypothetical protein
MSERPPAPVPAAAALAAFLAWPAPTGEGTEFEGPRRTVAGDGLRATAIALVVGLLLVAAGMALPIGLGVHGTGFGSRSHVSLFCHLL